MSPSGLASDAGAQPLPTVGATPSAHRRQLLVAPLFVAGASILPAGCATSPGAPRLPSQPFSLGVASGDPTGDGFVIWTRLVGAAGDDPLEPVAVAVRWEVAEDQAFSRVVASGRTMALPAFAHAVQVAVTGLRPARWYWYRFHAGTGAAAASSPVGRSRTFASADDGESIRQVRLAFASCQQYEQGYYGAYQHMLADEPDAVLFLGDYIYESSWGRDHVRKHDAGEPMTLAQYRARYALYRRDPDLQRMHAAVPWIVTWDDHEVQNDYADDQGQDLAAGFLARRAAAYRAWSEYMPRRQMARRMLQQAQRGEAGADLDSAPGLAEFTTVRVYDRVDLGRLASILLLDDRQYRSHQACPRPGRGGSNVVSDCAALRDPSRTMLGAEQEAWLAAELRRPSGVWNVLAQQTLFAMADQAAGPAQTFWTDGWDGYPMARQRLLDTLASTRAANPLILGGDVHANWVCDVRANFDRDDSPVIASEFCGTSITSQGGPIERHQRMAAANKWVKLAEPRRRGYGLVTLDASRCVTTLRTVATCAFGRRRCRRWRVMR